MLLLELADSIMTYRSRYLTTPMLPPVIDLLLLDETNPRSVAFQVAALIDHVDQLPRDADERRRARRSSGWCCRCSPTCGSPRSRELCDEDSEGRRGAPIGKLLDTVGTGAARISPN